MNEIMQSIPAIISAVLLAVLVLTVITNIITEVLKKALDPLPTNILAVAVAMVVTLLAFFAALQVIHIAATWYLVCAAVGLGFFVAFAAMFGFDKLKQTLGQITEIGGKLKE